MEPIDALELEEEREQLTTIETTQSYTTIINSRPGPGGLSAPVGRLTCGNGVEKGEGDRVREREGDGMDINHCPLHRTDPRNSANSDFGQSVGRRILLAEGDLLLFDCRSDVDQDSLQEMID